MIAADGAPAPQRQALALELRAAAQAFERLCEGQSLPEALLAALAQWRVTAASRPAVQDFAYRAVRQRACCEALARRLNARPPAPALAALQVLALSLLLDEGRRHEAVVVDQAVAAARLSLETAPAAGFLNATLRRFLREREPLLAAVSRDPEVRWGYPQWWIDQVRTDHPQHWQAVLEAGNAPPPLTLRVNLRRLSLETARRRLAEAGHACRVLGPQALRLDEACDVARLPGFEQGDLSVQDLAAQLAAPLLDARDGDRVLDACAAPGGKTAHLRERADCHVTAIDIDAGRLEKVSANLRRLGLEQGVELQAADAARPQDWWDGRPFQRILLDAPCSASGIVRRHPDIRWLRRRRDLDTLSRRQAEMLGALWPLLEPGGTLLFATCSIFRAEGESVVGSFCDRQPDALRQPLRWRWEGAAGPTALSQLLPQAGGLRDHDGFFFASLQKRT